MEPIYEIVSSPKLGQEIIFERNIIRIPFDTEDEREKRILELIKNLQTKVTNLEKEKNQFNFLSMPKAQAKEKIISHLKIKKNEGHGMIEVFELSSSLKLPATQVEEIIEELELDGAVKEVK